MTGGIQMHQKAMALCCAAIGTLVLAAPAAAIQSDMIDLDSRPQLQAPTPSVQPQQSPVPREVVAWTGREPAGSIVISTKERRLYFVLPDGKAVRYGVGVGRPGFEWGGTKVVTRKAEWPDWTPPAQMLRRRPDLPRHMKGGIDNPLGARAMYLGSSLYRIHGSNEPDTIGQAVSSGCIRMTNDDVTDLYERVKVGARVTVMR
jgi:lipoprotein-anchoring transpeptidase ErfK/SrfK